MQLDERTKLIAWAHLKTGKKPKEVSELTKISYSQALQLSKQLIKAEEQNNVQELFNLEEATLNTLLEKVSDELEDSVEVLTGDILPLDNALANVANGVEGLGVLEKELQDAAIQIVRNITANAIAATGVEGLATMTDALTKLQVAFFAKGTNIQVNNLSSNFEKYLKD